MVIGNRERCQKKLDGHELPSFTLPMFPDLGLHWQVRLGSTNQFMSFILTFSLKLEVGGVIRQN